MASPKSFLATPLPEGVADVIVDIGKRTRRIETRLAVMAPEKNASYLPRPRNDTPDYVHSRTKGIRSIIRETELSTTKMRRLALEMDELDRDVEKFQQENYRRSRRNKYRTYRDTGDFVGGYEKYNWEQFV